MPARSKKKNRRLKKSRLKKNGQKRPSFLSLVIIFLLILLGYVYFSGDLRGRDRISVVIQRENGDVQVSTFDFVIDEIVNIIIPADTQVNVARNFGKLKIKNVWRLGENEGLVGILLAETVTRHFKFPLHKWAEDNAYNLTQASIIPIIKGIIIPYKSNIKIGDRLRLGLLSFRVHSSKRVDIRLENTPYITKTVLTGGEEGYLITGLYPDEFLGIFSDPNFAKSELRVEINNASGSKHVSKSLGEIVEVLGGKVVAIDNKENESDFDCFVSSNNVEVADVISDLFQCNKSKEDKLENTDIKIEIGKQFANRY